MTLRRRHLQFIESDVSHLRIGPPKADFYSEMKVLHALALQWGAVVVLKDKLPELLHSRPRGKFTLSGTSIALRWAVFLGAKFNERSHPEQVAVFRHELSHIFQQHFHGEALMAMRYGSVRWRFAYECGAESEGVYALAAMGIKPEAIVRRYERWIEFNLRPDGLYKYNGLDFKQAAKVARKTFQRAIEKGLEDR